MYICIIKFVLRELFVAFMQFYYCAKDKCCKAVQLLEVLLQTETCIFWLMVHIGTERLTSRSLFLETTMNKNFFKRGTLVLRFVKVNLFPPSIHWFLIVESQLCTKEKLKNISYIYQIYIGLWRIMKQTITISKCFRNSATTIRYQCIFMFHKELHLCEIWITFKVTLCYSMVSS